MSIMTHTTVWFCNKCGATLTLDKLRQEHGGRTVGFTFSCGVGECRECGRVRLKHNGHYAPKEAKP